MRWPIWERIVAMEQMDLFAQYAYPASAWIAYGVTDLVMRWQEVHRVT